MSEIQLRIILEILGRPPEHIVEGLKMLVEKLKNEKGVKLQHFKIHEPTLVKEAKDLYTTFADVEIAVDSINSLFMVAFNYMPANIEVIYPENVELNNNDLNHAVNQLIQRLHNYDAVTKNVVAERDFLAQRLKVHEPHLFNQPQQSPLEKDKKKKDSKLRARIVKKK
ncbi:MAG: hypothetical protein AABX66_04255 [Nanoarchaeota archaeon]